MIKGIDNRHMGSFLIILFVLLVGPAALLWGRDSRTDERDLDTWRR
jgi:hypothetical protein